MVRCACRNERMGRVKSREFVHQVSDFQRPKGCPWLGVGYIDACTALCNERFSNYDAASKLVKLIGLFSGCAKRSDNIVMIHGHYFTRQP